MKKIDATMKIDGEYKKLFTVGLNKFGKPQLTLMPAFAPALKEWLENPGYLNIGLKEWPEKQAEDYSQDSKYDETPPF